MHLSLQILVAIVALILGVSFSEKKFALRRGRIIQYFVTQPSKERSKTVEAQLSKRTKPIYLPPEVLALIVDEICRQNEAALHEWIGTLDCFSALQSNKTFLRLYGYTSYLSLASSTLVSWVYEVRRGAFRDITIIDSSGYASFLRRDEACVTTLQAPPRTFLSALRQTWGLASFVSHMTLTLYSTSTESHRTASQCIVLLNSLRSFTLAIGKKPIRKFTQSTAMSIELIFNALEKKTINRLSIFVDLLNGYDFFSQPHRPYPFKLSMFPIFQWSESLTQLTLSSPVLEGCIPQPFVFLHLTSLNIQVSERMLGHDSVDESCLMGIFNSCRHTLGDLRAVFHCSPKFPATHMHFPRLRSLSLNLHFFCDLGVSPQGRHELDNLHDPQQKRPVHAVLSSCPSLLVVHLEGDGFDASLFDYLPASMTKLTINIACVDMDGWLERQPTSTGITSTFVVNTLWGKSSNFPQLEQLQLLVDPASGEQWSVEKMLEVNNVRPKERWEIIWTDPFDVRYARAIEPITL
ncbi:hypothetical protein BT69DRAFT_1322315 [Atractiella rhizophila]|nr:hypothetical protein BT69DRAFT_1322315 [Atractiella rhizophila]